MVVPQEPAAESAAFGGEASALVIRQPEASPLYLLLQDAVLLHHVLDDVVLVAVEPPCDGHEQHLQGIEVGNHSPILPYPTTRVSTSWAEFSDSTRSLLPHL